jgi:putative ABC transport system substrate-binding protein
MSRRALVAAVAVAVLIAPVAAGAQQAGMIPRIGFLTSSFSAIGASLLLTPWLKRLGYLEGQNIAFEQRFAAGDDDQLPRLAAELVRSNVSLIVTTGTPAIRAVKEATSTIPIVMLASGDPVSAGLITSLARPGGNITGVSALVPELSGKRLELLKEVVSRLTRVAVLWNPADPDTRVEWSETQAAARRLGLQLVSLEVRTPADLATAFQAARNQRAGALVVLDDRLTSAYSAVIADLARQSRLPAMYARRQSVDRSSKGLMSYGTNTLDLSRRLADYVDRILKGARPADLPVEQPQEFELAINLATADALGLKIPEAIRVRASVVVR